MCQFESMETKKTKRTIAFINKRHVFKLCPSEELHFHLKELNDLYENTCSLKFVEQKYGYCLHSLPGTTVIPKQNLPYREEQMAAYS